MNCPGSSTKRFCPWKNPNFPLSAQVIPCSSWTRCLDGKPICVWALSCVRASHVLCDSLARLWVYPSVASWLKQHPCHWKIFPLSAQDFRRSSWTQCLDGKPICVWAPSCVRASHVLCDSLVPLWAYPPVASWLKQHLCHWKNLIFPLSAQVVSPGHHRS